MTAAVEQILNSFEALSNSEKLERVTEIVPRAGHLDYPPLSNEELAQTADEVFLIYDKEEAEAALKKRS